MAAITAFREPYLVTNIGDEGEDWGEFDARRVRYAILWAWYESTVYRDIHSFATKLKADYGLYKHVRAVYNPAARICNFYKDHIWGGWLDDEAGDSDGSLPIETDNEALRPAIARLWEWSNWQTRKDITTLWGTVFGDVALQIVDDVERGKVYMAPVPPGRIKELELDPFGNVKGYEIEYRRPDPDRPERQVTYLETAERDGDNVVYATFKNGSPFAWNGTAAEWKEPYGFVPLVVVRHVDVGLDWGWSELQPDLSKFREVDDLASKFDDHIRKTVDPYWLFAGVSAPTAAPAAPYSNPSLQRPEPSREELPALYGPVGAQAHALIGSLDLQGVNAAIQSLLNELERDYPELRLQLIQSTGEVSGRALRIAQKPVEGKVRERRGRYDKALVKAQQMALAIAGFRKLEDFGSFSLDSYAAGKLDHTIAKRDVFANDTLDDLEVEAAFWQAAAAVQQGGGSLEMWLEEQGWDEEKLKRWRESPEAKARTAQLEGTVTQMEMMSQMGQTDGGMGGPMPEEGEDQELGAMDGLQQEPAIKEGSL